ncbi:MAG: hypothetical protein HY687_03510 [Chloroflexi bacterium]|nr:hypothetical protein [Chloroflexota bacterium]
MLARPAVIKAAPGGRRRAMRLLQIGLVLVLVGAVLWSWTANTSGTISPPHSLGTLTLKSQVVGPEAVAQVSELHGKKLPIQDAFVARYTGAQGALTAWVSLSASESEAADLLQRMLEGIRAGNRMFTGLTQEQLKGRDVYRVYGQGQSHYFYRSGVRVVWLAIEAGDGPALLKAALDSPL